MMNNKPHTLETKEKISKAHLIDITGKVFGKLTVIKYVGRTVNRRSLWLCRCECGIIKAIQGDRLRNGDSKTCGCSRRVRPFEALYNILRGHAKQYGHEILLTYEEFLSFTNTVSCVYCSREVMWSRINTNTKREGQRYNLDRKNNSLGYSKENCVVCCKECNLIKGARFTYEQMLQIGALIKTWHT